MCYFYSYIAMYIACITYTLLIKMVNFYFVDEDPIIKYYIKFKFNAQVV